MKKALALLLALAAILAMIVSCESTPQPSTTPAETTSLETTTEETTTLEETTIPEETTSTPPSELPSDPAEIREMICSAAELTESLSEYVLRAKADFHLTFAGQAFDFASGFYLTKESDATYRKITAEKIGDFSYQDDFFCKDGWLYIITADGEKYKTPATEEWNQELLEKIDLSDIYEFSEELCQKAILKKDSGGIINVTFYLNPDEVPCIDELEESITFLLTRLFGDSEEIVIRKTEVSEFEYNFTINKDNFIPQTSFHGFITILATVGADEVELLIEQDSETTLVNPGHITAASPIPGYFTFLERSPDHPEEIYKAISQARDKTNSLTSFSFSREQSQFLNPKNDSSSSTVSQTYYNKVNDSSFRINIYDGWNTDITGSAYGTVYREGDWYYFDTYRYPNPEVKGKFRASEELDDLYLLPHLDFAFAVTPDFCKNATRTEIYDGSILYTIPLTLIEYMLLSGDTFSALPVSPFSEDCTAVDYECTYSIQVNAKGYLIHETLRISANMCYLKYGKEKELKYESYIRSSLKNPEQPVVITPPTNYKLYPEIQE